MSDGKRGGNSKNGIVIDCGNYKLSYINRVPCAFFILLRPRCTKAAKALLKSCLY